MTQRNTSYIRMLALAMLSCLLLSACESQVPEALRNEPNASECIEADDWGDPKIFVNSYKDLKKDEGESIFSQHMPWVDSGQILIDANHIPLVMTIRKEEKWTSWYNGVVDRSKVCQFTSANSCAAIVKSQGMSRNCTDGNEPPNPLSPPDTVADCYVPCWIDKAYGLYMLAGNNEDRIVYRERNFDPDASSSANYTETTRIQSTRGVDILSTIDESNARAIIPAFNDPSSSTYHLGRLADSNDIRPETRLIYLTNDMPTNIDSKLKTGDRLYFKIMDTFYADNAGGYEVRIKSGTKNATPGPLELSAGTFEAIVNMTAEYLYKAIVNHVEFIRAVQALLILYIAIYGFKFMLGMDNTHNVGQFLLHIFKASLLIQLISPTSWEFFYVYLFRIFTEGVTGMLGMLASPFGQYDPTSPWVTLDMMLHNFFSRETWIKMGSLIFSHPFIGIFLVFVISICIFVFLISLIAALILYLQSYMMMGFLLILFPILLIFIILKRTEWIFQEWLKQMIAIAIQLILLFGALGLFSILIMTYMEKTLGYRVCWMPIFGTEDHGSNAFIPNSPPFFNSMFPYGTFLPNVTDIKEDNYRVGTDPSTNTAIFESRYIDAPYLDTDKIPEDKQRFDKVNESRFYYLNPLESIPLLLAVYLVFMFIQNVIPTLAANMQGGLAKAADSANIFDSKLRQHFTEAVFGRRAKNDGPRGFAGLFQSGAKGAARGVINDATFGYLGHLSDSVERGGKAQSKHTEGFGARRGGLIGVPFSAFKGAQSSFEATSGQSKDYQDTKLRADEEALRQKEQEIADRMKAAELEDEKQNVIAANEGKPETTPTSTSPKKLTSTEIRNLHLKQDALLNQMGITDFTQADPGKMNAAQKVAYQEFVANKTLLDNNQ